MAAVTSLQAPPRLRILLLHSFRTSAAIFKEQIRRSGLQRPLNEVADLIYLEAPHSASGDAPEDVAANFSPPYFEWWNHSQDKSGNSIYDGFKESEELVRQALRDHAPVHGICGFSQGAALASLLAGWQQQGTLPEIAPLHFYLMIGGTPSRGHAECYQDPLQIASLHFIGEKDYLKKYSQALADLFVEPVVIRHKGGHSVPALASEQAGELRTFLLHQANRTAQANL